MLTLCSICGIIKMKIEQEKKCKKTHTIFFVVLRKKSVQKVYLLVL